MLDISIEILNNVARVFYNQVYYNDSNTLLETEFFFPISTDACFDSFEATFQDTVIKGVVKEKKEAKQLYQDAVQQGRTVAYSEIDESGDVMKTLIGNIPPQTNISIKYSYIQKLETTLNKFWCFQLFSSITPKYKKDLNSLLKADFSLFSSYPTVNQESYPWNISVEIQSSSPITFIKSPLYDIVSEYGNENHTCKIKLDPQFKHYPNKDFVLLYSNGEIDNKMNYFLTPFEDGYCAMINFLADFEHTDEKETYNNFLYAKETTNSHAMDTIRGEYIFLLDCSGSMSGRKIEMAKNSLLLFLKSLPKNSTFNIIRFGSNYHELHYSSVVSSQHTIEQTIATVQNYKADLGGTNIYSPLKRIFDVPPQQKYPRMIFLLTDGEVDNTYEVLEMIKQKSDEARVFTVGIGHDCSSELVIKSALYGKGKHEFVFESEQIIEKVINLLNYSLSPCFSDLSLRMENFDAVVASAYPNPVSLHSLVNGESVTFFLFLRSAFFQNQTSQNITLRFYDSRIDGYREIEGLLSEDRIFPNELIPKLAIFEMIKELDTQKKSFQQDKAKRIIWMNEAEIEKSLIDLSIKYGVLSSSTAFFCDVAEKNQSIEARPMKVVVPSIKQMPSSQPGGPQIIGGGIPFMGGMGMPQKYKGIHGSPPTQGYQIFGNASTGGNNNLLSGNSYNMGGGGGGLFGNPSTGAGGGGLFGNSSNNRSRGGGGLFGNSGSQKQGGGGLFGNGGSQNQGGHLGNFGYQNMGGMGGHQQHQQHQQQMGGMGGYHQQMSSHQQMGSMGGGQQNLGGGGLFGNNQSTGNLFNQSQLSNPQLSQLMNSLSSTNQNMGSMGNAPTGGGSLFGNNQSTGNLFSQSQLSNPQYSPLINSLSSINSQRLNAPTTSVQNEMFLSDNSPQPMNLPQTPTQSNKESFKGRRSYIDVVLKQKFEGNWEYKDNSLSTIIFPDGSLPPIPQEIESVNSPLAGDIWITILVLVWLEMVCVTDRKAWSLVHQKGCEWLLKKGVDYEVAKVLATGLIKSN